MGRNPRRARRAVIAVLAAMALVTTACGDDDDAVTAPTVDDTEDTAETEDAADSGEDAEGEADGDAVAIPVVDVVTTGEKAEDGSTTHRFEPLEGVTAGPTQLNLVNEGLEPHHVQLFKLADGSTMEDVQAALATGNPAALLEIGVFAGGTGVTDPGSESAADALVDLEEGTYVMLCFIEGADGVPHLALGMVQPFEVGPADGEVAEMPEPDVTVNLVDFGFDANELPATGVVEVVNGSEAQAHEMNLLQLAEGKTGGDVAAFFRGAAAGPPPFASVGGMQALLPGASQLLLVEDVPPGDYMMICLIPDPSDGVPHAEKGMAMPATVA